MSRVVVRCVGCQQELAPYYLQVDEVESKVLVWDRSAWDRLEYISNHRPPLHTVCCPNSLRPQFNSTNRWNTKF